MKNCHHNECPGKNKECIFQEVDPFDFGPFNLETPLKNYFSVLCLCEEKEFSKKFAPFNFGPHGMIEIIIDFGSNNV